MNVSFSSMAAYAGRLLTLTSGPAAKPVRGARVSPGFFRTLGVAPVVGRDFHQGGDPAAAPPALLISYRKWRSDFGGSSRALGSTVVLDGNSYTLLGVLPAGFQFAPVGVADYWIPLQYDGACEKRRGCHNLYAIGRLKAGVSFSAASADVRRIASRLEQEFPDTNKGQASRLIPLTETVTGAIKPILIALLSGAGLLLLIATVNVASLLLVRSESRLREIAIRNALGAGRARIVSQLATESFVLVAAASAAALLGASYCMRFLLSLVPPGMLASMPFLEGVGLTSRVLVFAAILSCGAAAVFAVAPALHIGGRGGAPGLSESSRGYSGTLWRRIGGRLVVMELTTTVVLLAGAGLLSKSLYNLLNVELNFTPSHIVSLLAITPVKIYDTPQKQVALSRRMITALSAIPGVQSVGHTSDLPVTTNGDTTWIRIAGRPYNGVHNEVLKRQVSPAYFSTLGVKLMRGRFFTEKDEAGQPKVAIVNRAFAALYFLDENAIGKQMGDPRLTAANMHEVVGIIDNLREGPLDDEIRPAVYTPFDQSPDAGMALVVQTGQAESTVLPQIVSALEKIDGRIVTLEGASMQSKIGGSSSAYLRRLSASLTSAFAGAALLLSAVGLYGVISYSVRQRTREVGVRMALGARKGNVYALVLREAAWLVALGIALGLGASLLATRFLRDLLFGVQFWDPLVLASVALVLAAIALAAAFLPARRAASVNPVNALRTE